MGLTIFQASMTLVVFFLCQEEQNSKNLWKIFSLHNLQDLPKWELNPLCFTQVVGEYLDDKPSLHSAFQITANSTCSVNSSWRKCIEAIYFCSWAPGIVICLRVNRQIRINYWPPQLFPNWWYLIGDQKRMIWNTQNKRETDVLPAMGGPRNIGNAITVKALPRA